MGKTGTNRKSWVRYEREREYRKTRFRAKPLSELLQGDCIQITGKKNTGRIVLIADNQWS